MSSPMNVGPGLGTRIPPPSINPHIVPAYSLIVAGATHAGKSSLLRLILDTAPISPHATQAHLDSLARFVRGVQHHPEPRFADCEVEVLWAGERVLLRLFDTPGLDFSAGAEDELERGLRDIITLVEGRYVEGARDESTVGESHVHLCLYILDPANIVPRTPYPSAYRRTSSASSSSSSDPYSPYSPAAPLAHYPPSLPPAEISAIRRLSSRVNVLPVLGRCDAVGVERLTEIKRAVRRDLADAGLGFGIFDEDGEAGVAPTALPVPSTSASASHPASPRAHVKPDPSSPPHSEPHTSAKDTSADTQTVPLLPFALFAPECYAAPARKMNKRDLVGMYAAAIEQPQRSSNGTTANENEHGGERDRDADKERMDALRGRFVRRYRWGVLDVLDAKHSDFAALRRAAMVHRKVLKTYTKDYLYEKFKVDSLLAAQTQQPQPQPRLSISHAHLPPTHGHPHSHGHHPTHLSPHAAHSTPALSHPHHSPVHPHAHPGLRPHSNSLSNVLPPPPIAAYSHGQAHQQTRPQAQLPPIVPSQHQHQHLGSVHALLNHTQGHAHGHHGGARSEGFKRERDAEGSVYKRERDDGGEGESEGVVGVGAGPGVEGTAGGAGAGVTANGRKRKITMACNFCRSRKLKCDGLRPACAQCVKRGNTCDYQPQAHGHSSASGGAGSQGAAAWKYKRRDTIAGAVETADPHANPRIPRHPHDLDINVNGRHDVDVRREMEARDLDAHRRQSVDSRIGHGHGHGPARPRDEDVDELDDDVASSDDARTVYEGRKRQSVDMLIAETLGDGSGSVPGAGVGVGVAAGKPAPQNLTAPLSHTPNPHVPPHHHASPHSADGRYADADAAPGYAHSHPSETGTWYAETEGAGAGPGMGVIDVGSEGDKKKRLNRQSANYGSKAVACVHCRARKTRCDAARPACGNCARRSLACSYIHTQPSQPRSKGKKAAAAAAKEEAARNAAKTNGNGSGSMDGDGDSGSGRLAHGSASPRMAHGSTSPRMTHELDSRRHSHDSGSQRHSHESTPRLATHELSLRTSREPPQHQPRWQHHSPSRSPRPPHSPIRVDDRIIEESAERDRPLSRSPAAPPIATLAPGPPAPARSPVTVFARSPATTPAPSPAPPIATLPKHAAVFTNGHSAVFTNGNGPKHDLVMSNGNSAKLDAILSNPVSRTPERGPAPAEDTHSHSRSSSVADDKVVLGGKRKAPLDVSDEEREHPDKRRKWRDEELVSTDEERVRV